MDQQDRPGWNPPPAQDAPLSAPETVSSGARRSRVGTGVAVAAIAIGALGIAGTAYAASASNSPAPASPGYGSGESPVAPPPGMGQNGQGGMMPGRGDRDGDGRGHGGGMGLGLGLRGGIHGSFVTEKPGGGYQTVDAQRGTVTAVSKDSITVKSSDGFSATYVVTADTLVNAQRDGIASIKVGDEVGIVGIENAGSTTAVQITDRTQIKDSKQKWAPPNPDATPDPTTSGTA